MTKLTYRQMNGLLAVMFCIALLATVFKSSTGRRFIEMTLEHVFGDEDEHTNNEFTGKLRWDITGQKDSPDGFYYPSGDFESGELSKDHTQFTCRYLKDIETGQNIVYPVIGDEVHFNK